MIHTVAGARNDDLQSQDTHARSVIAVQRLIGAVLEINCDVYRLLPADYAASPKARGAVRVEREKHPSAGSAERFWQALL
jgi:hypothetical protein